MVGNRGRGSSVKWNNLVLVFVGNIPESAFVEWLLYVSGKPLMHAFLHAVGDEIVTVLGLFDSEKRD